jgi:hypothetical protein
MWDAGRVNIFVRSVSEGNWSVAVRPVPKEDDFDRFRPSLAVYAPADGTRLRFGLSYLKSDSSGNLTEWITTSEDGETWTAPKELSAGPSWQLTRFAGDYQGMAATRAGDFFPSWVEQFSGDLHVSAVEFDAP